MISKLNLEELLGLQKPWQVEGVVVDKAGRRVTILVTCEQKWWANEGGVLHVHGWQIRQWRHLDLWQCETIIEARVPRLKDPRTGQTITVQVPWAESLSRITKAFENQIIEVLQATQSTSAASALLDISWSLADTVMKRAVARGMSRREVTMMEKVGIDEKSFGKGQDYICLMTDLTGHRVVEVEEGGTKEAVKALWFKLTDEQRFGVKAAAMDRGKAMIAGTQEAAPQAVIVVDKFHIAQDQNKAVDKTRRDEHRDLMKQGDQTLTGSKYAWLSSIETMSDRNYATFNQLVYLNLKTARGWVLKSTFEDFWNQPDKAAGLVFFNKWYQRAIRSRLPNFIKLAKSLKGSLSHLLNYFTHRISNAMTEGYNSVVQQLKANARGFRTFSSYRARILFFCGKLDMLLN